ncbi:hypothetical protein U1E44_09800 [Arenibacter sp. GZD96]|uniref:hypothetical protein n=1 Tax=Aurantibrevibacter litoralis TaxID=3106030 RepID=UPI002AFDE2DD|nr:hypothetical protein [Arenibacter sp. GZD-96]MEA1786384.1 hypothetical protein [Arenibacter sp. GZD-96]
MKKVIAGLSMLIVVMVSISAVVPSTSSSLKENFILGTPEIASINKLTFGPEGILFLGDSKSASIVALDTKDTQVAETASEINIQNFDEKIAAALGTAVTNIEINDMAVNPLSKVIYFAVNTTDGTAVLLKLNGDQLEHVSLENIAYSKVQLEDAVAPDAKDRRNRPLRIWAISGLKYYKGQLMVSGLSNKEFSSTFRSIPFPFKADQDYASLEIYHAAHGQYETYAPIKTFNVIQLEDKDYLIASYTCTPLVLFPIDELRNGVHVKGRTVAELGAGNSPIDMISIAKEGNRYFLMSNTNRPIMRIAYTDIVNFKDTMTEPVPEFSATAGVDYISLPLVNVLELDNLDATKVVYLQRTASGALVLTSRSTQWM